MTINSDIINKLEDVSKQLSENEFMTDTSLEFFITCPLPMWIKKYKDGEIYLIGFNTACALHFNLQSFDKNIQFEKEINKSSQNYISKKMELEYEVSENLEEVLFLDNVRYVCHSIKTCEKYNNTTYIITTIINIEKEILKDN